MSSGTGVDVLDEGLNAFTNVFTFGQAGYGKDGFGMDKGVAGKQEINFLKEITGAKAAEEANAMARDQFNQEVAAKEVDRANAVSQKKNNQLNLSNNAQKLNNNSSPNKSTKIVGDVTDFLGL